MYLRPTLSNCNTRFSFFLLSCITLNALFSSSLIKLLLKFQRAVILAQDLDQLTNRNDSCLDHHSKLMIHYCYYFSSHFFLEYFRYSETDDAINVNYCPVLEYQKASKFESKLSMKKVFRNDHSQRYFEKDFQTSDSKSDCPQKSIPQKLLKNS